MEQLTPCRRPVRFAPPRWQRIINGLAPRAHHETVMKFRHVLTLDSIQD